MFRSPMIGMALAAAALGGCTTPQEPARPWASQDRAGRDDQPVHRLAGYEAHFVLGWNGARIGDALESLRRHGSGLRFERRERMSLSRGGAVVHSDTAIIIDTDLELRATSIVIRQISGDSEVRGRADRGPRGQWLVRYDDEPARELPAAAVPAELVPLLVRSRDVAGARQPGFSGPVILAGYGFAVASLGMSVMDEHTVLAVLETRHGMLRGRFWFTQGGTVARVEADDGSSARRVSAEEAGAAFDPPEVLEPTIVPIANAGAGDPVSFVIGPVERALPPPLPGQRIEVDMDTWRVHLDAGDVHPPPVMGRESGLGPGSASTAGASSTERPARSNESVDRLARSIVERARVRRPRDQIIPLARATADLLQDDLGSPVTGARAALALGRGDCTAHAVLFASLAGALDIEARLVTGYRVDGGRLVRHRWAIAAIDGAWIAVDPTFGEAPAAARLLGLAIHDVSAADMALADELAFAGFGRAHARALAQ